MSKGLEALHNPRIELANIDISAEDKQDIAYMPFYKTKQYTAIEQELKALEIIKKRPMFSLCDDLPKGTYRMYDCELYSHYDLTKEEYELLKEVLL